MRCLVLATAFAALSVANTAAAQSAAAAEDIPHLPSVSASARPLSDGSRVRFGVGGTVGFAVTTRSFTISEHPSTEIAGGAWGVLHLGAQIDARHAVYLLLRTHTLLLLSNDVEAAIMTDWTFQDRYQIGIGAGVAAMAFMCCDLNGRSAEAVVFPLRVGYVSKRRRTPAGRRTGVDVAFSVSPGYSPPENAYRSGAFWCGASLDFGWLIY